jgi:peroxiredoxin
MIMTIQVGDKIPAVEMQHMTDDGVSTINSDELFSGKKVVLFALPGAFTPTCSASHLPGYVVQSDALHAKGVDQIVCLSVNDAFVMDAWGKQHNAEDQVMMLADGSGNFTSAVDLQLDLVENGMGMRSQRYAMVVNDGVVESLNVEAAGKFEVSDAETILASL